MIVRWKLREFVYKGYVNWLMVEWLMAKIARIAIFPITNP